MACFSENWRMVRRECGAMLSEWPTLVGQISHDCGSPSRHSQSAHCFSITSQMQLWEFEEVHLFSKAMNVIQFLLAILPSRSGFPLSVPIPLSKFLIMYARPPHIGADSWRSLSNLLTSFFTWPTPGNWYYTPVSEVTCEIGD